jgi:hypothetical protein
MMQTSFTALSRSVMGLLRQCMKDMGQRTSCIIIQSHRCGGAAHFRIEMPVRCLPSLSTIPAWLSRSWGFGERVTNPQIIDKYFDQSKSPFIKENFGFLSDTFQPIVAMSCSDIFRTITLIEQASRDNPQWGKSSVAEYVTDERQILERLGEATPTLSLTFASDLFVPYLVTDYSDWSGGVSLVVGDSVDDRLLFWNQHHRQEDVWIGSITGLRLPTTRMTDTELLTLIKKIVAQRGRLDSQSRRNMTVRSCSLSQAELDSFVEVLRGQDFWGAIHAVHHDSHAACIPSFSETHPPHYRYNISFAQLRTSEALDFSGDQTQVPHAVPWHMREALPPATIRDGNWIVDLTIDRLNDRCGYASERHAWVLPRRLPLHKSFKVVWPDDSAQYYSERVTRVSRHGLLSLPKSHDQRFVSMTMPDDIDAFRNALCTSLEWLPFDRGRERPALGRDRYAYAEPSDKGRYLLTVLEHFENLPDAFAVLMNGFWREVLIDLGAVPAEKNPALRSELATTLRKRFGNRVAISSDEDFDRLAREAIRFGRKAGREARHVAYGALHTKWTALLEADLQKDAHLSEAEKGRWRDVRFLDRSIQHLCRRNVLFQGREWKCRLCYNKNWAAIDNMRGTLECEVCKRTQSAPVSGDWHFQASSFVLEAYREHGVKAVVWTLWRLSRRARRSFYFAPSMCLWETYPQTGNDGPIVELDVLAVVDGELYLCEAKSSSGLNPSQIEQLAAAATRVRPDVLLVSCMDEPTPSLRAAVTSLQSRLAPDVRVELLEFRLEELREGSMLPA